MIFYITASLDDDGLNQLRSLGEVRYYPLAETKSLLGGSRLVRALEGVDVFITEADNLKARELEQLTSLQIICSCRGNPVNIDVQTATTKGIPVIHTPGRNAEGVADLAVALMLMLGRHILQAESALRRRDPAQEMTMMARVYFDLKGTEMWCKTVGIVGFGAIGRKVAARLLPFGCQIIACDPFVEEGVMAEHGAGKVDLDALLAASDYVTLHVMPNEANRGMIGKREIDLMKPTAYFINTARSALTDEAALCEALATHQIAGAGLDVYDKEPLPLDHPLMKLENVVLLPHIGGNTLEVTTHQTQIVVPDIVRLIHGEKPHNIMNPEVLGNFKFRR
ncbi:MAG: hydroxyacid dehydrogenase [Chloroflexi bacterium]|nr:hydroxyacid dehydrogenase [Chloroflexota bacterium]